MHLRTEPLPGNPTTIAIFYGPILLAGDLGHARVSRTPLDTARQTPALSRLQPVELPGLVTAGRDVAVGDHACRRAADVRHGRHGSAARHAAHSLLSRRCRSRYTVYWRVYHAGGMEVSSHEDLGARRDAASHRSNRRSMSSTPTTSNPSAPMRATISTTRAGRGSRAAMAGTPRSSPFGYTLKVLPDSPVSAGDNVPRRRRTHTGLRCARGRSGHRHRDHPTRATGAHRPGAPGARRTLTRGKATVSVTYQPHSGALTAAVFEVRTIRQ